jgi:hypothetical protein
VLGVALVAAVVSYEHASDLVLAHGERGWTARLIPLTVNGLIYASSMVMLDSARRSTRFRCWHGGSSAWAEATRATAVIWLHVNAAKVLVRHGVDSDDSR